MSELEKILALVEQLELELRVLELELDEEGVMPDEGYYSNKIGEIKEMLYNESTKQISDKIDNSGFQGQNMGDGLSGFRG